MPEAPSYTAGKPDNAGGPLPASTYTWKPVYIQWHLVCTCGGPPRGRAGDQPHRVINGSRYVQSVTLVPYIWKGPSRQSAHRSNLRDMKQAPGWKPHGPRGQLVNCDSRHVDRPDRIHRKARPQRPASNCLQHLDPNRRKNFKDHSDNKVELMCSRSHAV